MENYKIKVNDVNINKKNLEDSTMLSTFKEVETSIPKELVDKIQDALKSLNPELLVSEILIEPYTLDVFNTVMEIDKEGHIIRKYNVTISNADLKYQDFNLMKK